MKTPNFIEEKLVDENGKLSPIWRNIFISLFDEMTENLSDEGIKAPHQTTLNITKLNTTDSTGKFLYDTDLKKAFINIDGTFKEIQTV